MSNPLGEALALYDKWGATFLNEAAITAPIVAAARKWHTLTNDPETVKRMAAAMWPPPLRCGDYEIRLAQAAFDALTDTAEPPEDELFEPINLT